MIKKDVVVKVDTKTRKTYFDDNFLGLKAENLQNLLIFEFIGDFVSGAPRVEIEKDGNKYIISEVERVDNTYQMQIKSSLLTSEQISMQLVITEVQQGEEIPIFKSKVFTMIVEESINASTELPDEYETLYDRIQEKIAEVENLNIEAERVSDGVEVTITDKQGIEHTTKVNDGIDGEEGFSPIANVVKEGDTATITIIDKEGTTTAEISDGEDAKINGRNTITISGGTNIDIEQSGDTLTINNTIDLTNYYTKNESDNKYVEKEIGKGLSTNDYTTEEKTKLVGIETGAEVNDIDKIKVQHIEQPIVDKTVDLDVPTRDDIDDIVNVKTNTDGYIEDAIEYRTFNKVIDGNSSQGENPSPDNPQEIEVIEDSIDVKVTRKNLCDGLLSKKNINDEGIESDNNYFISTNNYIQVDSTNTYNVSFNYLQTNRHYVYIVEYDNNKNFIIRNQIINTTTTGNQNYSFNINSTTKFIKILIYSNSSISEINDYIENLQLEVGSTATPYEPYQSQTATIDLQDEFVGKVGNVKDEVHIDKLGNVSLLKKIGKVVLDGSVGGYNQTENWLYIGISNFPNIAIDKLEYPIYMTNYFKRTSLVGNNDNGITNNGKTHLLIRNNDLTSLSEYQSWLSTHNTEVYYELAEPYTIDLGNIGEIKTYKGINNIEITPDTTFSIEYAGEVSGGGNVDDVKVNGTSVVTNKVANIDLTDYVKNTDYATENSSGVVKTQYNTGTQTYNGFLLGYTRNYDEYNSGQNTTIISKGTLENVITGKELLNANDVKDNIASTDSNKPLSANMGKELNDRIQNLASIGKYLAMWDCTTGLPTTNPVQMPYTYTTGDYYVISKIGTTNYMPNGSTYTGTASTTEYIGTETLAIGDFFYYDGTIWSLMKNTGKTVAFANIAGSPMDNSNLASALNGKVGFEDYATSSTGGVLKIDNFYGLDDTTDGGKLRGQALTYANYQSKNNFSLISKGTLENVIAGKGLVPTIVTSITSDTLVLNNHQEARLGTLATLILTMPDTIDDLYETNLTFTSGSTATTLTYSATPIYFVGDDCNSEGEFIPESNTTYEINIKKIDSTNIIARVGAV